MTVRVKGQLKEFDSIPSPPLKGPRRAGTLDRKPITLEEPGELGRVEPGRKSGVSRDRLEGTEFCSKTSVLPRRSQTEAGSQAGTAQTYKAGRTRLVLDPFGGDHWRQSHQTSALSKQLLGTRHPSASALLKY